MENTSDSFMPRPLLFCVKSEKSVSYSVPDNTLCATNQGSDSVEWETKTKSALYLDRLGVRVRCQGKGIGRELLVQAKEIARKQGAEYLRLFVVEENIPALRLYQKNGFTKAKGIYQEVVDESLTLYEYGYEIRTKK